MNDKGLSVLEQYPVKVSNTYRGRGALLCETNQGLKLLRELNGSKQRIEFQDKVLTHISANNPGNVYVDSFFKNKNEEIISYDKDNTGYILKDWYEGRDCDVKEDRDIIDATANLARLHKCLVFPELRESFVGNGRQEDLVREYEKHNRELKKVKNYIRDKGQMTDFEICFMKNFMLFYERGEEILCQLRNSTYEELQKDETEQGKICHGDYNYHNIILLKKNSIATTNFNKCHFGMQVKDLYQFMRKILEKRNWSLELGNRMLETYENIRPLSSAEKKNLFLRLSYPEKFWKLANQYYNMNKAWIPNKNIGKLVILLEQNKEKELFLSHMRL